MINIFRKQFNWLILLQCYIVTAQELPPIKNFTPLDYKADNQNWSSTQTSDKLIYVANNKGLLEYNGAKWTLYPSPNETVMRSVQVINDKIYTGCYQEFGYWQRNNFGLLDYVSLSGTLKENAVIEEEFWNILEIDKKVVFQSLHRIYIYDLATSIFNIIDSEEAIIKMFEVNEKLYFQKAGKGLYEIKYGKAAPFLQHEALINDELVGIFSDGRKLILVSKNNGFYSYNDNRLTRWESNPNLSEITIYNARQLSNGDYLLGTISNGLIYFSKDKNVIYQINQANGLVDNTVLSIFEDMDQNIWLGLDYGVSYINTHSAISVFEDPEGTLGSVYAACVFNEYLYLGTNQGLFYKPVDSKVDFKLIAETKGQVWSLNSIQGELFCGHHNGTMVIEKNKAKRVSSIPGTWSIITLSDGSNRLLQGNYDGLYILEQINGQWGVSNKITGFNSSARHFEVLGKTIFVSHEYNGIYELHLDSTFSEVKGLKVNTLLKGENSGLAKFQGQIIYACKQGVFKYSEQKKDFLIDSVLSAVYSKEDYVSGRLITDDANDQFWMFTKNNQTLVSSGGLTNDFTLKSIPLTANIRNDVTDYESVANVNGLDKYIFGTSSGYIAVDIDKLEIQDFSVYLSTISKGDNTSYRNPSQFIDQSIQGQFGSRENNFRINYYTPQFYKYFQPVYQFRLVGIYDEWSNWSTSSSVFFENLPSGIFTFEVRAKIGDKTSVNTASYSFSIARPWYYTNWMIALYIIAVLLFSVFMHIVYRRYYHRKQTSLMESTRRELQLTKLQSEKEIIRLENEQLEKENKNKSNELAASTMSIVKKNELLTSIKEQLLKLQLDEALKPVIATIDSNLNQKKNWELFKEAFDNADSEFFHKIKKLHPNLTPNDLKLCAYLRLNLSSKEIAPLLHISPRSVEIKRYRLRKKLNLSGDDNLTNYIIAI